MTQAADQSPRDVADFVRLVRSLPSGPLETLCDFFAADRCVRIARAPGRLDVMGGLANYSGSLVLQLPIAEAALAAVQAADDGCLSMARTPEPGQTEPRRFSMSLDDLRRLAGGSDDQARAWFQRNPDSGDSWAACVAGALIVLARHHDVELRQGLRILIHSHVPEGKAVGASAALEVASMQALAAPLGLALSGGQLAQYCHEAQNRVVGTSCGIPAPMTAAAGHQDQLLALLCQPAEILGFLSIPSSIRFWGIDSGIAVSGSEDLSVRTGAFMGYRILADLAGLEVSEPSASGEVRVEDPAWRGYLANLTPREFAERFAARLPREMSGADFLQRYGGTTDSVTRVEPSRRYAVYQPALHSIRENDRVRRFATLLGGSLDEASLREMGGLMVDSHESYSACGLGSPGADMLVQMVLAAGPACGLYGARITGGGSGGTVAILGEADAEPVVRDIAARYARQTGRQAGVFAGSSGGACDFGVLRLDRCTAD